MLPIGLFISQQEMQTLELWQSLGLPKQLSQVASALAEVIYLAAVHLSALLAALTEVICLAAVCLSTRVHRQSEQRILKVWFGCCLYLLSFLWVCKWRVPKGERKLRDKVEVKCIRLEEHLKDLSLRNDSSIIYL